MKLVASELRLLVRWVFERDTIRMRKEQGLPRPWTEDPWLRDYRWGNVRRMDDRVSLALFSSWYRKDEGDAAEVLAAALVGRLVNWPETLSEVTGGRRFSLSDLKNLRFALSERSARGEKVFTAAYRTSSVPGQAKIDSVCDLVEDIVPRAYTVISTDMRSTWLQLFLAPEV